MAQFRRIGVLLCLLQAAYVASPNPETALDAFKSLQGTWAIQSGEKTLSIQMTYEVGSKGSIVTEQFGKELSVFYRDGANLLLTHFCNAGNQPRLRLKAAREPGLFEFEMFDITNLKDKDTPHVQRIIYRIISDKKMGLEIVWKAGSSEEPEKYTLTRN